MTPTRRPRREGPVISEERERHPVAANVPLASRSIRSRGFAAASFMRYPCLRRLAGRLNDLQIVDHNA